MGAMAQTIGKLKYEAYLIKLALPVKIEQTLFPSLRRTRFEENKKWYGI